MQNKYPSVIVQTITRSFRPLHEVGNYLVGYHNAMWRQRYSFPSHIVVHCQKPPSLPSRRASQQHVGPGFSESMSELVDREAIGKTQPCHHILLAELIVIEIFLVVKRRPGAIAGEMPEIGRYVLWTDSYPGIA